MVAVYGYPLQLTTGNCRHVFKRMPKIFDSVRNVGISLFSQNNSLCKLLNLALKVKFRYVTVCSKMVCMCIWLRRYLRSRVLLGLLSFLLMRNLRAEHWTPSSTPSLIFNFTLSLISFHHPFPEFFAASIATFAVSCAQRGVVFTNGPTQRTIILASAIYSFDSLWVQ